MIYFNVLQRLSGELILEAGNWEEYLVTAATAPDFPGDSRLTTWKNGHMRECVQHPAKEMRRIEQTDKRATTIREVIIHMKHVLTIGQCCMLPFLHHWGVWCLIIAVHLTWECSKVDPAVPSWFRCGHMFSNCPQRLLLRKFPVMGIVCRALWIFKLFPISLKVRSREKGRKKSPTWAAENECLWLFCIQLRWDVGARRVATYLLFLDMSSAYLSSLSLQSCRHMTLLWQTF